MRAAASRLRVQICDNGVDDDLDSQTDCDDLDCKLIGDCGSTEVCDDGEDNDGDGQTDCEDTACIDLPGCQ